MLYFAYGSNLDPDQMQRRCPGHIVVGLGALHDYKLVFPRHSHDWGGGVASVQPSHAATVWGVVYDLTDAHLATLDTYEGFHSPGDPHNAYEREGVYVELTRPDDGSVPRRVRVQVYVGRPANPTPPSRRYLDAIVKGAKHHRLPAEYVASMAATPAAPEPPPSEAAPASS